MYKLRSGKVLGWTDPPPFKNRRAPAAALRMQA